MKQIKYILTLMLVIALALASLTSCDVNATIDSVKDKINGILGNDTDDSEDNVDNGEGKDEGENKEDEDNKEDAGNKEEEKDPYNCITVAEALKLCKSAPEERYNIRATVVTILNAAYGEMRIADETGEIYVYGTYSADGSLKFPEIEDKPVKGDEIVVSCILNTYNDSEQVKNARLLEVKHVEIEVDESLYTDMSIADVRESASGTKVKLDGVVARIAYANGQIPCGLILVDGTSSVYVYDGDIAGRVKIGDKITIIGEKTYWILDSEKTNAAKFGYIGACQIASANLVSIDGSGESFDKSWIEESTVKDILDTPVTENVTSKIYKVNALVKKVENPGYVNYYFFDIDGKTSAYTYTQCNGADFAWLDAFDGKICTVYITALNAKSTATDCYFRFLPVEVIDEGYTFDVKDAAEFAVKYHAIPQFIANYSGDPALELVTSVTSDILGITDVPVRYSSDNTASVYFEEVDGNLVMHCAEAGVANITVSSVYADVTYTETYKITVSGTEEVEYVGVSDAIAAEVGTTVTVKGIVGPSLANQSGFYLIDESGAIAVRVDASVFDTIAIGYEVVLKGERTVTKDGGGQICLDGCEIVANYYGSNDYSTASFIKDKTVADIKALADTPAETSKVYVLTGTIKKVEGAYSTNYYLVVGDVELMLYSGGAAQYSWLNDFVGKEVTVDYNVCDWNAKGLKGCILAVYTDDGKVLNTLNFK